MKTKSTIGIILQVVAALIAIGGAAMVVVILGLDKGSPESLAIGMAAGIVVAFAVVILLGAAELLHAVMRTAAATEETVEMLTAQVLAGRGSANRQWSGGMGGSAEPPTSRMEAPSSAPYSAAATPVEVKCPGCASFFTLPRQRAAEVACPHCAMVLSWPD